MGPTGGCGYIRRREYHCRESDEFRQKVLSVEPDVRALVATEVTVVGCAEDGYALFVVGLLVALLLDLVGTDQQI